VQKTDQFTFRQTENTVDRSTVYFFCFLFTAVSVSVSAWTLVAISVERYYGKDVFSTQNTVMHDYLRCLWLWIEQYKYFCARTLWL